MLTDSEINDIMREIEESEGATFEEYEDGLNDLIGTALYNHIERCRNLDR